MIGYCYVCRAVHSSAKSCSLRLCTLPQVDDLQATALASDVQHPLGLCAMMFVAILCAAGGPMGDGLPAARPFSLVLLTRAA